MSIPYVSISSISKKKKLKHLVFVKGICMTGSAKLCIGSEEAWAVILEKAYWKTQAYGLEDSGLLKKPNSVPANDFSSSAPESHIHPFLNVKLSHQYRIQHVRQFQICKQPTLLNSNHVHIFPTIKHLSTHTVTEGKFYSVTSQTRSCGFLTEAKACPGSTLATSWSSAPRGAAGAPASAAHARPAASSAAGWSSAVTEGSTGASPHPTAPLRSSTRTATLETATRREDAMVKGAASGTSSRRASAAATSTEKVSLSASKPNDSTGVGGDGDGEMARREVVVGWRPPGTAATRVGLGVGAGLEPGPAGVPESRRGEEDEERDGSMITGLGGEAETGSRAARFAGKRRRKTSNGEGPEWRVVRSFLSYLVQHREAQVVSGTRQKC